ncbi:hypothetical protein Htur_5224 (plasmid) [Haloterrigena turkmenica DSM 5511]|uniref:DUF7350 domain-containing protein n=1 Tax=Haloterrigena turkmenica (strain ATCC 51198 / DSM 5511 / JCM 9101 / NCIMB 13204 / VKM B-1734 / 4k) TaxID=543526 RepID=D2S3A8_HALTV|nr:twin-arginine translocation signal domain-containing protein [Haloterrigena turkmenica]ADB63855.1 hypothetical protein Htur_5224 [Haloterrigena turkmenica DSM 5511]
MNRRAFLRGTAVAGTAAIAGCLERLGFEEESAWDNPPLVEDRPDAVYLPAGKEEMGHYGRASDGEYAVELSYTIPHRFWTVSGDTQRVDVDTDDSMHLMLTVWDEETDTILPVNTDLELQREDGEVVEQLTPWSMLSQRMGTHYGDNVTLPEEGAYTARVRVGPVTTDRTGAFEGRFEETSTLEVEFEFERSDIHDLEFNMVDEERRGAREAHTLMDPSGHDGHGDGGHGDGEPGHAPTSDGPPVAELPGDRLGTERSADAKITAIRASAERVAGDGDYLVVCPRTPYNDVSLPSATLRATVERDGTTVLEGESLAETIDPEFGHHYGLDLEALESGDELTVAVDRPPQVARHDGYETAFFDFDDVRYTVS